MKNLLTCLFDYKVKRFSLALAVIIFIADMVIRTTGENYINSFEHHVLFWHQVPSEMAS
jgi:hypothetical protein